MSSLHSFKNNAHFQATKIEYKKYSVKSSFIKVTDGNVGIKGSVWDSSYFISNIDYTNKKILEVGARDSILGAYLTDKAASVTLIDYFQQWGKGTSEDLGSLDYWKNIWKNAAIDSSKLVSEEMNILTMTYPDKSFDIVIAISVLSHMKGQTVDVAGHLNGLIELARVCKDDGCICISVPLSTITTSVSGVYVQDYSTLLKWIADCNLEIVSDNVANLEHFDPNTHEIYNIKELYPVCDAFIVLKKL